MKEDFCQKALSMGYGDLRNYFWYHTVDLENGLVTPGHYDYRSSWPLFGFAEDMTGLNVLDIGSATGFFAFEFEKRGANVVSVELPSIAQWDMFLGEYKEQTLRKLMTVHKANTIEELHYLHLDGPFEFCQNVLGSKVRRVHSTIYDLTPEKLEVDVFDIVFIGDVLLHLFSPLRALVSVAPLCQGTLVVSQEVPEIRDLRPTMLYVAGEKRTEDTRTWWLPNIPCFEQMFKVLGFNDVKVVGYHEGIHRPSGRVYKRAIIHATKNPIQ
ncbi:MAG: hypothetical protein GTN76_05590 [Candidatus Aenigmarchaeota archaeon]|nr:hypothetical protein [Candidatus Aenigmarchaeota archaeon]